MIGKVSLSLKKFMFKPAGILILYLALVHATFCQTYTLPDTNFRNILKQKYPEVMTGDQLNITAAGKVFPDLIIPEANISDLSGVEYFTGIYKLNAISNNITHVPDLSGLKNLGYLYLNQNKLSETDFFLKNTNLLQLQLMNNQFTSFPELTGFSRLEILFLRGNKLKELNGLSNLKNLTWLNISANFFDSLPDLSQNTKIFQLHSDQNNLKNLKGIEALINLKTLYCGINKINDLSHIKSLTSLEKLYAERNSLASLPDLSGLTKLTVVDVSGNKLTFEDLLPLTVATNLTEFNYAPQDSVGSEKEVKIRSLDQLTLKTDTDQNIITNTYTWYKDNNLLQTTNKGKYTVSRAGKNDSGTYKAAITNSLLPLLTLHHRPWKVSIDSICMDVQFSGYRILSSDCGKGTEIKIEFTANGAQSPVTYKLKGLNRKDSVTETSQILSNISPGKYSLTVEDQRGCKATLDSNLTIFRSADCDPVISPFTGSPHSSYFIDKQGTAKILDLQGNVICELKTPAVWDGTKTDGSFAETGYYVITVDNNKLTNISVIR
jgi:internalin A